jgi:hypothetical protein
MCNGILAQSVDMDADAARAAFVISEKLFKAATWPVTHDRYNKWMGEKKLREALDAGANPDNALVRRR